MLNLLAKEDDNKSRISDELMENLIPVIEEKGYKDEGKDVTDLVDTLVMNKRCIPPFVQYKGIDATVKELSDNDSDIELAHKLFNLFKNVAIKK